MIYEGICGGTSFSLDCSKPLTTLQMTEDDKLVVAFALDSQTFK